MKTRYRPSFWDIANCLLAALLVITLVRAHRRLPPDWMVLQTWSMRWEWPDGKPLSTNFIYQTSDPRREFGSSLHENRWFGPPTIDMPVPPETPVLRKLPVLPQRPASAHIRLSGTFVQ